MNSPVHFGGHPANTREKVGGDRASFDLDSTRQSHQPSSRPSGERTLDRQAEDVVTRAPPEACDRVGKNSNDLTRQHLPPRFGMLDTAGRSRNR